MNVRRGWPVVALALVVAASGCSSRLVKVRGRVTYQGKPVPSTQVTFLPENGGRPSKGTTDDNGNFTLRYSRTEAGATRGKCTVFLQYVTSNEEELGEAAPKASPELKAVIASYGDPNRSPLHYEITRSGEFFEIELK